jgi:hypothetical protein
MILLDFLFVIAPLRTVSEVLVTLIETSSTGIVSDQPLLFESRLLVEILLIAAYPS